MHYLHPLQSRSVFFLVSTLDFGHQSCFKRQRFGGLLGGLVACLVGGLVG